jgi:hypothetical protein
MTRRDWLAALAGGLLAGTVINVCEWAAHRWWLDSAWRDAFAVLGRTPRGWSAFIPANFWLGVLAVLAYRWLAARDGPGRGTLLRTAAAIWVIFWVIPTLAMQPLDLFPNTLLWLTIAIGAVDGPLGTIAGVWLYERLGSRGR